MSIAREAVHSQEQSLLDTALWLARQGIHVFPCHSVNNGACSCGKSSCDSKGKHPRYRHHDLRDGLKDATTDELKIRRWWKLWPDANIGIRCGKESGIFVLDFDNHEALLDLEQEHGKLPPTWIVTTGRGVHYYFKHPNFPVKCGKFKLVEGMDIKGDGGYVVGAGSSHASGRRYEFESSGHPDDVGIAEAPQWLLSLIAAPTRKEQTNISGSKIPVGRRNNTLFREAVELRKRMGYNEQKLYLVLQGFNKEFCEVPLPDREIRKTARSAAKYKPYSSFYDTNSLMLNPTVEIGVNYKSVDCTLPLGVKERVLRDTKVKSQARVLIAVIEIVSQLSSDEEGFYPINRGQIGFRASIKSKQDISRYLGKLEAWGFIKRQHNRRKDGPKTDLKVKLLDTPENLLARITTVNKEGKPIE